MGQHFWEIYCSRSFLFLSKAKQYLFMNLRYVKDYLLDTYLLVITHEGNSACKR
jgi:hypothetical protein